MHEHTLTQKVIVDLNKTIMEQDSLIQELEQKTDKNKQKAIQSDKHFKKLEKMYYNEKKQVNQLILDNETTTRTITQKEVAIKDITKEQRDTAGYYSVKIRKLREEEREWKE